MRAILVVEDEPQVRAGVCRMLRRLEMTIHEADCLAAAIDILDTHRVDLILTDVHLPDGVGFQLIDEARRLEPEPGVVVMTGDESVDTAISALHRHADDYLLKPFSPEALRKALGRAERKTEPVTGTIPVVQMRPAGEWRKQHAPRVLGEDAALLRVFDIIQRVADTDCSVMVHGDSGTGKELIARALHDASNRAAKPFVTVNCAAIPDNLIESELFGHAKGSFTGATTARIGRFQAADGGTLFLDEVGELPLALQAKLLRAVQEKEVTPVGENRARKVDVRLVTATHRDLEALVEDGKFREDLLYRLQVVPIELPALRERQGDIPALVHHFVERTNERRGRAVAGIDDDALRLLCGYEWPGNIRQLENTIERMVLLAVGETLAVEDVPRKIRKDGAAAPERGAGTVLPDDGIDLRDAVEQFENTLIRQALERTGWNKNQAAAVLRMNRTTLVEKLKKKKFDNSSHAA